MNELVYAGKKVEDIIKAKYPQSVITDDSDFIHTERFELSLEGIEDDEFYPFAIKEGFARCCFGFSLTLASLKFPEGRSNKPKENKEKLEKWIELAKTLTP